MFTMPKLSMLAAAATITFTSSVSAQSLVFGGQLGAESGGGLGNQLTVLTLQSPANGTLATGCIEPTGINPSCAITYPDAKVQQQSFERWIAGLTGQNLRIVFNSAEPGNNANSVIVEALTLYVYGGPAGARTRLGIFNLNQAANLSQTYSGTGTFGFQFLLDGAGATAFNAAIAGQSNLTVGLGARVSGATGGLETFSLAQATATVPEPSSALLVLSGLGALGVAARRKRVNG